MGTGAPAHIQRASLTMPTHEEVIAQNPLEAPAPFWDNVYYALNGFAAFFIASSVLGGFVCCCLRLIARVERWEESRCKGMTPSIQRPQPPAAMARGVLMKRRPIED